METSVITLTIPSVWLEGISASQDALQLALKLGLDQLRQQHIAQDATRVAQALLRTGRVNHLPQLISTASDEVSITRQTPPTLPGPSVSDILIAQRHGDT